MFKVRKLFLPLLTASLFLSPDLASATNTPSVYSNSSTVAVADVTDTNLREPRAYLLANGSTLVSWLEELQGTVWLKTRVVSSTNQLSPIVTVNQDSPAYPGGMMDLLPQIKANKKGNLFATWVEQTSTDLTFEQTVFGSTSADGLTWSSPFIVVPSKTYESNRYCEDAPNMADCGYLKIHTAINEQNELSVATENYLPRRKNLLSLTSSKTGTTWTRLTKVGTLVSYSDVDLVGLDKGFLIAYASYSQGDTNTSSVFVSYLASATSNWSTVQRATFKTANTGFHIKWVQRNSQIASLVIASQINAGGLAVRNLNLKTITWMGLSELWQPVPSRFVFQQISATSYGNALAVQYSTYDQNLAKTSVRVAIQTSIGAPPVIRTLENGLDQINPIFTGSTSTSSPFFAYSQYQIGTHITLVSGGSSKVMSIPLAAGQYVGSMVIDKKDALRSVVFEGDGGIYKVFLVQGQFNNSKK